MIGLKEKWDQVNLRKVADFSGRKLIRI